MLNTSKIITHSVTALIGAFILYWFFWPEITTETVIETKIKTDTVFVTVRDTVTLTKTKIRHEYLRDTVLVNFKPEISLFRSSIPFLYGNTYLSGEVLGKVLKMTVTNDFKLPTITNTITETKTITNTIQTKGLYVGGGIGSNIEFKVGASYVDKNLMLNYDYEVKPKIHWIGVKKKLF